MTRPHSNRTHRRKRAQAVLIELPFARWPASDREAYLGATRAAAGPLDDPGAAGHLAEATKRRRRSIWGRYLGFLDASGELRAEDHAGTRLGREWVTRFLNHILAGHRASTVRQTMLELSLCAAALMPQENWLWIRRLPGVPTVRQARSSRREAHAFDPTVMIARATEELDRVRYDRNPADLLWIRDLTIVIVGVYTKIRPRNLLNLKWGESLRLEGGQYRIAFSAEKTKRQRPIDSILAPIPAAAISHYLAEIRPSLSDGGPCPPDVWIMPGGAAMTPSHLAFAFRRATKRLVGRSLGPSSSRHAFATAMCTAEPTDLKTVAAGLTHSTTRTMLTYYDRSGDTPAIQAWAQVRKGIQRTAKASSS